mmetsp:Transcript_2771/g.4146  ORF Transcript_2771/g.4146 Transcript_2771/m.4146 type:complete len:132 (+) Transcript_2771:407-802(+)
MDKSYCIIVLWLVPVVMFEYNSFLKLITLVIGLLKVCPFCFQAPQMLLMNVTQERCSTHLRHSDYTLASVCRHWDRVLFDERIMPYVLGYVDSSIHSFSSNCGCSQKFIASTISSPILVKDPFSRVLLDQG